MAFDPGSWWNKYKNFELAPLGMDDKQKYKNPADPAMNYLNQIPGQAAQTYNPYIQQGQSVDPRLMQEYGNLMNNPGDVYNRLGSGYKESPGYQFKLKQALAGANNAQAAGGMLGSPQHQQINSDVSEQVASKDYEDYLNHVMGLYGAGLGGEQGYSDRGWDASQKYGDTLMNNLQNQANLSFRGQALQNDYDMQGEQNRNKLWGDVFRLGGTALGGYFGGPAGAAAGGAAGGAFGGGG